MKPEKEVVQIKEKGEKETELLHMVTVKYKVVDKVSTSVNERGLCMHRVKEMKGEN
jgi:hypothetical protein